MRQTWRWFGPADNVAIEEVEQAGATAIVTALHHIPNGMVWSEEEIAKRQSEIAVRSNGKPSQLKWEVVESLPVSEEIKKQDGEWRNHIAAYKTSLENLARAGLKVVCYNFMPVLDWTRTNLNWHLPCGASCMRFDLIDFAIFDIFILERSGASKDFAEEVVEKARARFQTMDKSQCQELAENVTSGLPGANQNLTFDDFNLLLSSYTEISDQKLRSNLREFLQEVVPVAENLGMRMCCHPDDPPHPLLGLPRIVSTEDDYHQLLAAIDSPANGVSLCSGSLGVNSANDLAAMMKRLGPKVHFLHLRNIKMEDQQFPGSFHESGHLDGDVDMKALVAAIVDEEKRRQAEGRDDWNIPMRPDHGHAMADDFKRKQQPGYPLIGRLRGLAELRGLTMGLGGVVQ